MAQQLGCRCVVYLPAGATPARVANLEIHDAEVTVTDVNYDDSVRLISERANDSGWLLVQDTAWEGYEEIPRAIMQGYLT
jgi:diaminopropionate ammonia-lyase